MHVSRRDPPAVVPQNSAVKPRRPAGQPFRRYDVARRSDAPGLTPRTVPGGRHTSGATCWRARARTGWARRSTRHRIVRSKPLYQRTPSRHPASHRQLPLRAGVSSSASSQLASPQARSRRRQPVHRSSPSFLVVRSTIPEGFGAIRRCPDRAARRRPRRARVCPDLSSQNERVRCREKGSAPKARSASERATPRNAERGRGEERRRGGGARRVCVPGAWAARPARPACAAP